MQDAVSDRELYRELGARFGVPERRVALLARAVERLLPEEIEVVEQLGAAASRVGEGRRRALSSGLARAIQTEYSDPRPDPLADLDEPMGAEEEGEAVFSSAMEAEVNRERLLRECVSVREAARRSGRSRQALERQRREGKVVALRVGREYRYPLWQFEPDGPGGRLPGLDVVLRHLRLSPAGAAWWLSMARKDLGGQAPREFLRRGEVEAVARLAEQVGHMP